MSKRRPFDFYETNEFAVKALLRDVEIGGTVLEPCNGAGAITRVLIREAGLSVDTNDVDTAREADTHMDATRPEAWQFFADSYDWIVTNPPFSSAFEIVSQAYAAARVGVAALLRLSWLEPVRSEDNRARCEWLVSHPPTDLLVLPRYSFTGNGKTDSVTCAWFVWSKQSVGQRIIIVPEYAFDATTARAVLAAAAGQADLFAT